MFVMITKSLLEATAWMKHADFFLQFLFFMLFFLNF